MQHHSVAQGLQNGLLLQTYPQLALSTAQQSNAMQTGDGVNTTNLKRKSNHHIAGPTSGLDEWQQA